jgi:NAD(P)-dependent dehydrogenase (short-subunit alcohol dehydrogenase family)
MQLLDGHVVLITGGGSGLGLGVARHCRSEGAELAILEYDPVKVLALKEEFGDEVLVVRGDVRSIADTQACRDAITERFGRLSALIGTQGIFDGMIPLRDTPVERIDALFDELFHVNVKGYILSARIFADLLRDERGAIVLTASTAAYAADGGGLMYTATKGAVRSVVNQLSFELAPEIRVNGVAPAGIANSQLRGPAALGLENSRQSDIPKEVFTANFETGTPMRHLPAPEEYGPLYAFLASRHNQIMTGQTVVADQGALNRALISASGVGGIPKTG